MTASSVSRQRRIVVPPSTAGLAPVIEVIGPCGARTPAQIGAGIAGRHQYDPALTVGVSGGAIAGAFLQAGATSEQLIEGTRTAPMSGFAQRNGNGFVPTSGAELRNWLDGWLRELGHSTWGDFRFKPGERHPALDGWTHRFNVQVTTFSVRRDRVADLHDRRGGDGSPDFWEFLGAKLRSSGGVSFRQFCFPQDVPELFPHMAHYVDRLPVADWVFNSAAHPFMFKPGIVEQSKFVHLMADGGIHIDPSPYNGLGVPPLPIVQLSMGREQKHVLRPEFDAQLARLDQETYPYKLTVRNGPFDGVRPLDVDLTPDVRERILHEGYDRTLQVLSQSFRNYRGYYAGVPIDGLSAASRARREIYGPRTLYSQLAANKDLFAELAWSGMEKARQSAMQRIGRPSRAASPEPVGLAPVGLALETPVLAEAVNG